MEDIDSIPLGIYKSFISRLSQRLNRPMLYDDSQYIKSMFKRNEYYSPINNTEYEDDAIIKRIETRRFNKLNKKNHKSLIYYDVTNEPYY